jgi:hypothetical protein
MLNEIIIHYGFPFTVASVSPTPAGGWDVVGRTAGGGTLQFTVPDGQPTRMRVMLHELLEAQL